MTLVKATPAITMAMRHKLCRLTSIREMRREIYANEHKMSEVVDGIINDLDKMEVENLME